MSVTYPSGTTGPPWFLPFPEMDERADGPTAFQALAERIAQLLGGVGVPTGGSIDWWTTTPPAGFLLCDGSAISRAAYPALFGVLGVTHGAGDGVNTFNLPDTRNRVIVGSGPGPFGQLGESEGAPASVRSVRHAHSHTLYLINHHHAVGDPGHQHTMGTFQHWYMGDGAPTVDFGGAPNRQNWTDPAATGIWVGDVTANANALLPGVIGNDWGAGQINGPCYIVSAKAIKT